MFKKPLRTFLICFISIEITQKTPRFFLNIPVQGKQIGRIKRNRKQKIKRINFLFLTFFYYGKQICWCDFCGIVEKFLNCMTNARRLVYGANLLLAITKYRCFFSFKIHFFLLFNFKFHYYAKKKIYQIRSKSTINYLFGNVHCFCLLIRF